MVRTLSNNLKGTTHRFVFLGTAVAAFATLAATLSGCGGSGMPVPNQEVVSRSAITRDEPTPLLSPSPLAPMESGYPQETDH